MEQLEAIVAVARSFPGVILMPRLTVSPDGRVHECVGCDFIEYDSGPIRHGTVLVDDKGVPYHERCKLRAVGL